METILAVHHLNNICLTKWMTIYHLTIFVGPESWLSFFRPKRPKQSNPPTLELGPYF